jgi:HSP20 family protein
MTNNRNRGSVAIMENETTPGAATGGESHKVGAVTYRPRINMYDLGDRYEMHVELPGAPREEIHASTNEGVLTIEARVPSKYPGDAIPLRTEYGVGNFRRQVRLGEDIDTERLAATYEQGVLTLVLPKLPARQPRRIPVVNS